MSKMLKFALGLSERAEVVFILIRCISEKTEEDCSEPPTRIRTTEMLCFELRSRDTSQRSHLRGWRRMFSLKTWREFLVWLVPGVWPSGWTEEKEAWLSCCMWNLFVYVRYAVQAFIPKPLQCKNCKGFGLVSSVCSWTEHIEDRCVEGRRRWGDHEPVFLECPVRVKEIQVVKVRAANQIYTEVITSCSREEMVVDTVSVVNVCCQTKRHPVC